jgi:hypothetical protein
MLILSLVGLEVSIAEDSDGSEAGLYSESVSHLRQGPNQDLV